MEDTGSDNHIILINGEDSGDRTHSLGYVLHMYDIWVSLKMTCLPPQNVQENVDHGDKSDWMMCFVSPKTNRTG